MSVTVNSHSENKPTKCDVFCVPVAEEKKKSSLFTIFFLPQNTKIYNTLFVSWSLFSFGMICNYFFALLIVFVNKHLFCILKTKFDLLLNIANI